MAESGLSVKIDLELIWREKDLTRAPALGIACAAAVVRGRAASVVAMTFTCMRRSKARTRLGVT
jgi:hypothetical protein